MATGTPPDARLDLYHCDNCHHESGNSHQKTGEGRQDRGGGKLVNLTPAEAPIG